MKTLERKLANEFDMVKRNEILNQMQEVYQVVSTILVLFSRSLFDRYRYSRAN